MKTLKLCLLALAHACIMVAILWQPTPRSAYTASEKLDLCPPGTVMSHEYSLGGAGLRGTKMCNWIEDERFVTPSSVTKVFVVDSFDVGIDGTPRGGTKLFRILQEVR